MHLRYETLERIRTARPVDRLKFIEDACRGHAVLDIGCYDETALIKRDTEHWLHGRIANSALNVIGIDSSAKLPDEGVVTGPHSRIVKGDACSDEVLASWGVSADLIVAGEFIEHIENPSLFLREVRSRFPDTTLILSTPNGISFANTLLGLIGREAQHPDHLHNLTFKTLNTLMMRSGYASWNIIPYRFFATEMLMQSRGAKRAFVILVERCIRAFEFFFPLLSFGYIVIAKPSPSIIAGQAHQ